MRISVRLTSLCPPENVMPKGLFNWDFEDVVGFLRQHFFVLKNTKGSHYYFRGKVDGQQKLTHIQKHGSNSIPPKTMESVIASSGIPKDFWIKWGGAGRKSARKKIQYLGAVKI